ncbi:DUF3108 domain-containing protein [Tahibacter soli]|uniref:DUF3108 domain-containing protein n=1 Tax=Tahibacter soli TaxID=2983605 RepID=A0A9X4BGW2_9GAMM|nr:DUF3108 domain-containing protein [Tahibacter soli]MDC8012056.1 DUF3108 domain-containing protein [Tahibacter soli]
MRLDRYALLLAALLPLAAHAAPKPFAATYNVIRNGKPVGETTMTLSDRGDGTWTLTSQTKGTAGMARMLGLDVKEESNFRWKDGKPEGVAYDFKQDATFKSKQRHTDFDWKAGEVRVVDNKEQFRYPIRPGTMDRHAVGVALVQALAGEAKETTLIVATKDHLEDQRFTVAANENVKVPAGSYAARRIDRVDVANKGRSWISADVPAPVKIEQVQGDGGTIVMELVSIR